MRWNRRTWMTLAAASGLTGVVAGAFAAHGLTQAAAREWMRTGAAYEQLHALATLACAGFLQLGAVRARHAPALFLGGTALFSGSLYAMALGGPHWLGAVTPIGGMLLLAGWAVLIWAARGMDRP
ncbi:MAG TPA: DUF423 domain-containing protein [Caulobacteraceae bacterium]